MPFVTVNGVKLYYEEYGEGEETIVFSHGFLFSTKMFEKQIEYLKGKHHIIAFDHRGQGQSEVTKNGYHIDNLTEDAKLLLHELQLIQVHFVGLSMGGFVGMRLAARYPEMLKSLVLINTSSDKANRLKLLKFSGMKIIVKIFGFGILKGAVMKSLFGESFLKDKSRSEEKKQWTRYISKLEKPGLLKSFEGAISRPAFDELDAITCPTLVIGGMEDVALSPDEAEDLHANISSSQLLLLEKTGHSSTIESPKEVSKAIEKFLTTNF